MTANGPTLTPAERPHRGSSRLTLDRDVRSLYDKHFGDRRKERQLFSTGSFFLDVCRRARDHARDPR